jgi:hypothetical protein
MPTKPNSTGSAKRLAGRVDVRIANYLEVFPRLNSGPPGWIGYMTERYGLV